MGSRTLIGCHSWGALFDSCAHVDRSQAVSRFAQLSLHDELSTCGWGQ